MLRCTIGIEIATDLLDERGGNLSRDWAKGGEAESRSKRKRAQNNKRGESLAIYKRTHIFLDSL
jgi:hypothetical protein